MVRNQHQIAGFVVAINAPGGIGQDNRLHAEFLQGADSVHRLLRCVSLIEVGATSQSRHWNTIDRTDNQFPGVSDSGGLWPPRNIAVRDGLGVFEGVCKGPQATAEYDSDPWCNREKGSKVLSGSRH